MVLQSIASELTSGCVAVPAAPAGMNWFRLVCAPGAPVPYTTGVSGSVPLVAGLAGLTAVRPAYQAAGVQGVCQLPVTCTGPPGVSLPLSNSRLCSTMRPLAGGHACAAVALSLTSRPAL